VVAPSNSKIADVRSIESLRETVSENAVLINLAAEHGDDVVPRSLYDDVNIQGAVNVCQVAREKKIKVIIFTSSVAVYGAYPDEANEDDPIAPHNDYGRTKYEAEKVYKEWQAEEQDDRTLVIIRPAPVIGETNRANFYWLMRQIFLGRFIMIGRGENKKSIAYVENVAAFLEYALAFKPKVHLFNYVDKPDYSMLELANEAKRMMGKKPRNWIRLPYIFAFGIGMLFDELGRITGKWYPISADRVKKFTRSTVYNTAVSNTGFRPPVSLAKGLDRTIAYEFLRQGRD
jgi:nucleoside-diphosphate-sugar epimerase